jgi:Gp19/Gp15/Gp42-like protein
MALATHEDVVDRWIGEPFEAEVLAVIDVRLDDAERILRLEVPDLLERAVDDADYHDLVVQVESEMVLRLVKNPEGYSQESDGNYSYAIYQQVASGRLEILDDELDWLRDNEGRGMFVITPNFPDLPPAEGAYDPSRPWPPPWWVEG